MELHHFVQRFRQDFFVQLPVDLKGSHYVIDSVAEARATNGGREALSVGVLLVLNQCHGKRVRRGNSWERSLEDIDTLL